MAGAPLWGFPTRGNGGGSIAIAENARRLAGSSPCRGRRPSLDEAQQNLDVSEISRVAAAHQPAHAAPHRPRGGRKLSCDSLPRPFAA
jgi:hypothetical protein